MTEELAKKVFPKYFENFTMPETAKEQEIEVYRACPTRKIEKASFLNTYEELERNIPPDKRADDPQVYCLSTNLSAKGLKRFVISTSKYQPPFLLAKGYTTKKDGLSCKSNTWKTYKSIAAARRDTHVDWWLYEGAEPWLAFKEVNYEYETKHDGT